MHLDVRIPLGLLFLILGLILVCFGFMSDPAIYAQHSLGRNVNLLWGSIFAVFGVIVLLISRRGKS
jgi:hypothetical protein